jgi:hypothetical protein
MVVIFQLILGLVAFTYVTPPLLSAVSLYLILKVLMLSFSSPFLQGVRLFQEGAQKIVGFDFSASLTMDMREELEVANSANPRRSINVRSNWSARVGVLERLG